MFSVRYKPAVTYGSETWTMKKLDMAEEDDGVKQEGTELEI